MSAAEKAKAKRAAAKARKAEFRKAEEASVQSQLQKEQEAAEREKHDKTKKKPTQRARETPVDSDPLGDALLAKAPLEEAWRLVSILKEYAPNAVETNVAAFDVAFRQQKYLLCLEALLAAPRDAWSAPLLVRLVQLYSVKTIASPLVLKLLGEAKAILFRGAKDLAAVVAAVKTSDGARSLVWRVAVAEAACLVDAKTNKSWISAWLLEDQAQGAVAAYEAAVAVVSRFADAKEAAAFAAKVKGWFPHAVAFGNAYKH